MKIFRILGLLSAYGFFHSLALRRQRSQRHLTLDAVSGATRMSPQHLSEVERGRRDPRLLSIERIAEAMGLSVMLVPEHMAPEIRCYIATQSRVYTTTTTPALPQLSNPSRQDA